MVSCKLNCKHISWLRKYVIIYWHLQTKICCYLEDFDYDCLNVILLCTRGGYKIYLEFPLLNTQLHLSKIDCPKTLAETFLFFKSLLQVIAVVRMILITFHLFTMVDTIKKRHTFHGESFDLLI